MNKSESIKELAIALAKAQGEMPVVKMDAKNPFLKYKYATLGAVINACRPILAKHNFSVVQLPVSDGDKIGVDTMLIHSSGEWIGDVVFVSTEEQKGLSQAQTTGVSITYLRRYSLASLLGIYADEDTDAGENHGENGEERPAKVLPERPKPEPKTPVPATDIQRLRVDFGKVFANAQALGLKDLPTINGKSTAEQIVETTKKIEKMIDEKAQNAQ